MPDPEKDKRVIEIKRMIDELNGDMSVEQADTLALLEEIEAYVEPMIAALEDDIRRERRRQ